MRAIARSRQPEAKALGERQPVRVVSPTAAIAEHDGVDGAECAGIVGKVREQRQHRLFAGVRDIQAVEAHALGGSEQIGQGVRSPVQALEIDQLIQAVQTVLGGFAFVHGWSQRR